MISSLGHIPEEGEEDQQNQNNTDNSVQFIQPRQSLNIVEETQSFMKRGGINTDRLSNIIKSSNSFKLNERDQMLLDILKQDIIDLKHEENQNVIYNLFMHESLHNRTQDQYASIKVIVFISLFFLFKKVAIYILRKKLKNDLETSFLNNVIKNLPFFQSSNVQQDAKDNSQFKRIVNAVQHRHISKYQTIFNHGEKGHEFFTVVKGSAFCLIPDPNYKKPEENKNAQPAKVALIEKKDNETKAETNARSFLNTLAQSLNKKNKTENNVLSFVDILRSQAKRKLKKPAKQLIRSTTKQLEEMFEEEDKANDNMTDADFLKQEFPGFILVKTFMPGDSFGEISLITSQVRSATLVAKEDSHFMVLDKQGFDKTMSLLKNNTIREKIEFIKSFEFFSYLCTKRVLQIIQQTKILNVNVRQNIYEEGDNSNYFFLIKEGEVELQSRYSNPQELVKQFSMEPEHEKHLKDLKELRKKKAKINVNSLHTVKILGQGSFFGEEEIVKGIPKREGRAICRGSGAQIFAIEKKRLYGVLNYNIFDKFKHSVDFKDEMKSERLKNVIKMQIPQQDIENLNEFLEKDKQKKELEIQKEQIKQELTKKLKMGFVKRYKDQVLEESQTEKITKNSKGSDPNIPNINDISDEISDSDVHEYNRQKNLEFHKKTFFKIHDKVLSLQKSTLEHPSTQSNININNPIFPVKEQPRKSFRVDQTPSNSSNNLNNLIFPGKEPRKSFRYSQVQTLDDQKMSIAEQKVPSLTRLSIPKAEARRSSKLTTTLDNSQDEYIQRSARSIQIKSFTNFNEIEDIADECQEVSQDLTKDQTVKVNSETQLCGGNGSGDEIAKYKINHLQSNNITKTDKLILNLSKNTIPQRLSNTKEQQAQTTKSQAIIPTNQIYNFQKSITPQVSQSEIFSPLKQRVLNQSQKILRIAGNGAFQEEADNTEVQNSYGLQNNFAQTPVTNQMKDFSRRNSSSVNKALINSNSQNIFHIRSYSKNQALSNPSEYSTQNTLQSGSQSNNNNNVNNNPYITPLIISQNSQLSTTGSNRYRHHIGAYSVPSFTSLNSSISNQNSIQITSKQSNLNQNGNNIMNLPEQDVIQEEPLNSKFFGEVQRKSSNQLRKSFQQNNSKDNAHQRISLGSPLISSCTTIPTFDERSYLKKPLQNRNVKKDIAPHKIRPITKIENRSYFNSVLNHSTQDTIFRNINISQQNLQQVRANSQKKEIHMTPQCKTVQNFHKIENKPSEQKEDFKLMSIEQFKKNIATLLPPPTDNNIIQETNSSSMSMLRIRRSILGTTDESNPPTSRPSSQQQFNKSSLGFQFQQPISTASSAVPSIRKIQF